MADTNWKLEGDTSQPRTLYLEYNDREIYIHKIPKCNSDTTVESSDFYTMKLERNQISMSRYLIIKSHF